MSKYIFSLVFVVGFASAATISTLASCDGVTTEGTFGASCNDGLYRAIASIDAPSFVNTRIGLSPHFSVSVDVSQVGLGFGRGGASASLSDDYVFTVFGGTGAGSFCPVINTDHGSGASATMSFAGIPMVDCDMSSERKSFTFGVPQIVSIDMDARASGVGALSGGASASLQSFSPIMFFDPAGHPMSNLTFTLVEIPEPTVWSLLAVGAMFFLATAVIGRIWS